MSTYTTEQIRTIALVGHGAGGEPLALLALALGELGLEAVVGLLGQPGDGLLAHGGKGYPRRART